MALCFDLDGTLVDSRADLALGVNLTREALGCPPLAEALVASYVGDGVRKLLLPIVLAHQPHFPDQPADIQVFWGYALFPDRVGNFVPKPMSECSGAEILQELCGHLRFDVESVESAICIPCRMPYITSMFMPRSPGDRPLPVPASSKNLAFISQFVEIPGDVVFTVEYSVRAAQMAVYQLLGLDLPIPPVTRHDQGLKTQLEALFKAFAG